MSKRKNGERLPMLAPRIGLAPPRSEIQVGDAAVQRETSWRWKQKRDRVLQREPLCRICRSEDRVTAATEVDHIIGLAFGGSLDETNLQPLCHDHHAEKTARENAALNGRDDRVVAVY